MYNEKNNENKDTYDFTVYFFLKSSSKYISARRRSPLKNQNMKHTYVQLRSEM